MYELKILNPKSGRYYLSLLGFIDDAVIAMWLDMTTVEYQKMVMSKFHAQLSDTKETYYVNETLAQKAKDYVESLVVMNRLTKDYSSGD